MTTASGSGRGRDIVLIAVVVVLGSTMTILDTTIVTVALNHLSRDFHAPLATIQWVSTAYTLALASVIPVTAWAIGRFGTKRVYMFTIALFTIGSVLAGLSWSAGTLIAFRVLQGLGGGMVTPVGMTIVIRAADPARAGRTMSILGIPVLIGPLAGPVLGGWLADAISWRAIFFVNLPMGALVLVLAARLLRPGAARSAQRLDVPGLLTLSPGLAALFYGLATGGARGDFGSPGVLVPTLLGAALIGAFTVRALTARHPLVDLRLFRRRAFASGAGALALFVCAFFGSLLLAPLYYQLVRGQSATGAGLLAIPQTLATGITMQIATRLADKVAPVRMVPVGVAVATTGFLAFASQVAAGTPYWVLCGTGAVMGVGVGMTLMPTMTAVTRNLAHDQVPAASTALSIIQQVAGSVGTALMSVLLSGALAARLPGGAGNALGAVQNLPAAARRAVAPRVADAFQYTYGWAVALMALALLPALLLPRRRPEAALVPADPASPVPDAV